MTYNIDGVAYDSLDDMPPEVRAKADRVLADRNNNGVPDIMEDFVAPQIGNTALSGVRNAASSPNDVTSSFERSALAAKAAQTNAAAAASATDRIRRRQMGVTAAVTIGLVAIGVVVWLLVK